MSLILECLLYLIFEDKVNSILRLSLGCSFTKGVVLDDSIKLNISISMLNLLQIKSEPKNGSFNLQSVTAMNSTNCQAQSQADLTSRIRAE